MAGVARRRSEVSSEIVGSLGAERGWRVRGARRFNKHGLYEELARHPIEFTPRNLRRNDRSDLGENRSRGESEDDDDVAVGLVSQGERKRGDGVHTSVTERVSLRVRKEMVRGREMGC